MGSGSQRLLCPTLVGRDDELAVLAELRANAAAGRGETVLIGGDAGIGKSALLRRLTDSARAGASRVLVGECIEIEARRPLGPFLDLVERARRAGFIRPEDAERLSPLLVSSGDETLQPRLHQAILRTFAGVARAAPVLLVVEDLHWADDASLEVFAFLARRLRTEPILLLGTFRTDELHRRHPLRPYIAQLVAARAVREMTLAPLRGRAVTQFVKETLHLREDLPPTLGEAIDRRCEGNPFFMEETLDALRARDQLTLRDGQWLPGSQVQLALPETVRDAVDRRVRTLDPKATRALRIAAVIGQRFDFDVLASASRIPPEQLVEHLRAAIGAQLVVERDEPGQFGFRHALTRESVMSDLLEPERRALHLRIAEMLEAGGTATAEELAYHFDEAGKADKAFHAHLRAADEAPFAARVQALEHIRRAVQLAPDGADLIDLYRRLATAEMRVDNDRGLRAFEDVAQRANAAGRIREAGDAHAYMAAILVTVRDPRGGTHARTAVDMLEPLGPSRELANALNQLGRWLVFSAEDPEAGREAARRGARVARDIGATREALACDVTAVLYDGDPTSQARALRAVIDEAIAAGAVGTAFRAYNNLFITYSGWPSSERDDLFEEWSRFVESVGLEDSSGFQARATQHWMRVGDFDRALEAAIQVRETPADVGLAARFREGVIRLARDGPSTLTSSLISMDTTSLIADARQTALNCSIEILLLQGEAERVIRLPDLHLADPVVVVAALCIARSIGNEEAVRPLAARAEADRHRASWDGYPARYLDAESSYASGDVRKGAELMSEVATYVERIDALATGTMVSLRNIDLLRAHDRQRAEEELARVVAFWRKAKATWYLGQLARWARERDLPLPADATPASTTRPTKSLTEREIEVARLVALGLTNKDISDRLVISERTAEGHVQRILDKLGFRSRSQIAAWHASGRAQPVA